jgi:hypothetical protein
LQEPKPPTEEEFKKTTEEMKKIFGPEIASSGILSEAEKIVDDRMEKYGVPTESWTRIGRMWGAYLDIPDIPAEVCLQMMTMMKKIRERYEHNPDNWVDDVGYVDCAHRVMKTKQEEEYKVECTLPGDNPNPWKSTQKAENVLK